MLVRDWRCLENCFHAATTLTTVITRRIFFLALTAALERRFASPRFSSATTLPSVHKVFMIFIIYWQDPHRPIQIPAHPNEHPLQLAIRTTLAKYSIMFVKAYKTPRRFYTAFPRMKRISITYTWIDRWQCLADGASSCPAKSGRSSGHLYCSRAPDEHVWSSAGTDRLMGPSASNLNHSFPLPFNLHSNLYIHFKSLIFTLSKKFFFSNYY